MSGDAWKDLVRRELGASCDDDVAEELAQHLSQRHDDAIARGASRDDAMAAAMAELAEHQRLAARLAAAKQRPASVPPPPPTRDHPLMLRDLWQDLRYGARVLVHSRAFTVAAGLTLALGIGVTTAIFSVVDAVLGRPVPFPDQDRLVVVWETDRNSGTTREPASLPDYFDIQRESRQFTSLGAFVARELTLTPRSADPVRLAGLNVTHTFLSTLGLQPLIGRRFTAEEDRPGGPGLALISERLWRDQFGGRLDVVGQTLLLDEQPATIVGVMPGETDFGIMQILRQAAYSRGFADRDARSRVDVWLPLQSDERRFPRSTHPFIVVGRLAEGATVESAQHDVTQLMARLEATYPQANTARGAFVEPMSAVIFGKVRTPLWVLFASVALVLLIACVNVANLVLARGAGRAREMAVRTAMGAQTHRLVRQFVAESLLLTLGATALGIGLAFLALKSLILLAPADIPRLMDAGIDFRVLLLAITLGVATAVAFGLLPIAQARRLDVQATLKAEESRGATAGRARTMVRSVLVVSQVALAVMLVIGAGLLIRSMWRLSRVDAGFATQGVVKAEFQLPSSRYVASFASWPNFVEMHRFNDQLLRRVSALPGVQSAAVVGSHPLAAGFTNSFTIVGREAEARNWPEISVRQVSPGYFDVVGLRLASGRLIGEQDATAAPAVGLINETAARRFFEGREPLGQQIRFWGVPRTIIGVVEDERIHGVAREAPPAVYAPLAQAPPFTGAMSLLVRSEGDLASMPVSLGAAIREIDPQLAVFGVEPLKDTLSESIGQQRFLMLMLTLFAALAVTLAAIGIYGILSYTVAQRRHEIGIHLALGAPPASVTRLVMRQGGVLALGGLVAGMAGAFALTRVLSNVLYGVTATDALSFAAVIPLLGGVALLAIWMPARRAARIDPLQAMREE